MRKNVLLMVHTNTWFTEVDRIAQLLMRSHQYKPQIHFAYPYPTIKKDMQKLEMLNIPFSMTPNGLSEHDGFFLKFFQSSLSIINRILNVRWLRFATKFVSPIFSVAFHLLTSLREMAFYKKLINDVQAHLVVMGGDLVGYNTPEIVRAAREENVACVIVPSTMSDGTEQAEAYFFNPAFSLDRPLNKLVTRIWPKWKKQHKGKWLVRVPAEQIIMRQLLETDPPLPWISNSTRADAIAVESGAMYDYYTRCGIDSDKLRRTGSLANDYMASVVAQKNILKSILFRDLNLDPQKKIILTALPPDSLYMMGGRPECEFKTYRELTQFWIQVLADTKNFNVVISLHPSVDIEEFRYLESETVKISQHSIVELIPLCDIFVASVSSTIRWAVTCAKPVINYDVYFYRYADFSRVQGVVYIESKMEYIHTIQKIDQDPDYQALLKAQVEVDATYWGCLDGLEGKRILDLFTQEIQKKS